MSRLVVVSLISALILSGCGSLTIVLPSVPPPGPATHTPKALTASPTETAPVATATETITPTATDTLTPVPSPTLPPALAVKILGCDTSADITHLMGEVTNAYVLLSNTGGSDANYVCATLSASDEGRQHPDKSRCVQSLPVGYQVTFKLTVDSKFRAGTSIRVDVTQENGVPTLVENQSCQAIGLLKPGRGELDIVTPIQ